jgi:ATP-dependent exoDNAse (exonuclease V) alpha subunit
MRNNAIGASILEGKRLGQRIFIPRVYLNLSEDEFQVTIRRRQFAIRPAFAMTINKYQDQTFGKVAIYLPLFMYPVTANSTSHFPEQHLAQPFEAEFNDKFLFKF